MKGCESIPIRMTHLPQTREFDGIEMEVQMPRMARPPEIKFVPCVPIGWFGANYKYVLEPNNKYYDKIKATIEGDPDDPTMPPLKIFKPGGVDIDKLIRLQKNEAGFQWAPRGIWREDTVKEQLFLYDVSNKDRARERRQLAAGIAGYTKREQRDVLTEADEQHKCNVDLEHKLRELDGSLELKMEQQKAERGLATTQSVVK